MSSPTASSSGAANDETIAACRKLSGTYGESFNQIIHKLKEESTKEATSGDGGADVQSTLETIMEYLKLNEIRQTFISKEVIAPLLRAPVACDKILTLFKGSMKVGETEDNSKSSLDWGTLRHWALMTTFPAALVDDHGIDVLVVQPKPSSRIITSYADPNGQNYTVLVRQRRAAAGGNITIEPPGRMTDVTRLENGSACEDISIETPFKWRTDGPTSGSSGGPLSVCAQETVGILNCEATLKEGARIDFDNFYNGIEGCHEVEPPSDMSEQEKQEQLPTLVCKTSNLDTILESLKANGMKPWEPLRLLTPAPQ